MLTVQPHNPHSEVKARGAYKIPQRGPVLFVVGPHANQFIDPMVLVTHAGRSVSFLMAKKSYDKPGIGFFGKSIGAIPVVRPQDLAKKGIGKLVESPDTTDDVKFVDGVETQFIQQGVNARAVIAFSGQTVEVVDVLSDTRVRVKVLSEGASKALGEAGSEGLSFKVTPHVDQGEMFHTVVARLNEGKCVGIFPEGGSHDRTDLLPLKAGAPIMALQAMAENEFLNVQIVPTGLNYFNAHKWRSRAVIEFGDPITITKEQVAAYKQGGESKRKAIAEVLDTIFKGLKSVTVTAKDYDSLMLIQAARRLYRPIHMKLTIDETVYLNRRFAEVFSKFNDDPLVQDTMERVKEYNRLLKSYGIEDHQVMRTSFGKRVAASKFTLRVVEAFFLFACAAPGALLHAPIALIAKKISQQKAAEALRESSVKIEGNDVVATWKVLVSLVVAPLLYILYSLIFFLYLFVTSTFTLRQCVLSTLLFTLVTCVFGVAAMRASEIGIDVLKSLRPLYLSIFADTEVLRLMRADLAARINQTITEIGPRLYNSKEEFEASRIIRPEDLRYGEIVVEKMNKSKNKVVDDFRWEEVDKSESENPDGVFLFKGKDGVVEGKKNE
ncbi:hypothetical protein BC830DRAFT_1068566 [Chytriomyces sp. MP71]|nr:hypothetical protein BC830DRAFT_1068566 [Chytriomyces sp. MP71]